jgi:carbamate kinase
MAQTIVIALGGNALQKKGEASASAQQRASDATAMTLAPLIKEGLRVAIVHGNGPQVGNIVLHEEAINTSDVPTLPLDSDVAMSQGLVGYWLQQSFQEAFLASGMDNSVATIVTQVVVDANDSAFLDPTKPIGPFYLSEEAASQIVSERGIKVVEDAGRGWRRVVPSPKPVHIVELQIIKKLVSDGTVVISCGGGGVPVISEGMKYTGVEAVIDKDFAAARLADDLKADKLIILTSVEAAMINFGKENQQVLGRVSVGDMKRYVEEGHFVAGSMLPKVQAAIEFVETGVGRQAIIASLDNVKAAVSGESGTVIF